MYYMQLVRRVAKWLKHWTVDQKNPRFQSICYFQVKAFLVTPFPRRPTRGVGGKNKYLYFTSLPLYLK